MLVNSLDFFPLPNNSTSKASLVLSGDNTTLLQSTLLRLPPRSRPYPGGICMMRFDDLLVEYE